MARRSRPGELIYDGSCGFCTTAQEWIMVRMADASAATPVHAFPADRRTALGLSQADLASAVTWLGSDGRTYRGARAVGHALRHARQPWRAIGWPLGSAVGGWVASPAYRLVARYRHKLPGATPNCVTANS